MTIILALLATAIALGLVSAMLVRRSGLRGRVVASDSVVARPSRALRSAHHGIVGKPDYLVEERGRIAPVELKPSRESDSPWLRDVVQLAAYCLLLEEIEPRFAGYGYLRYAHRTFRIDFTDRVRGELLRTIADMRADLSAEDVSPNHHDPRRCARCMLVRVCGRPVVTAS
ncbi:MAG TPA: Dna2/Cas4 domain-containing protein [Gemmatimonadaceae bacterium]|jgi:CRISPR-associated exonuclease Cas4